MCFTNDTKLIQSGLISIKNILTTQVILVDNVSTLCGWVGTVWVRLQPSTKLLGAVIMSGHLQYQIKRRNTDVGNSALTKLCVN